MKKMLLIIAVSLLVYSNSMAQETAGQNFENCNSTVMTEANACLRTELNDLLQLNFDEEQIEVLMNQIKNIEESVDETEIEIIDQETPEEAKARVINEILKKLLADTVEMLKANQGMVEDF